MRIMSMSLKVGNKQLLSNLSISFPQGQINHILGKNGIGKTCFAKACAGILPCSGTFDFDRKMVTVIGSYSAIPANLRTIDVIKILEKRKGFSSLFDLLDIYEINNRIPIGKLSDGQKQKIKLLYYLSFEPKYIILDEFSSALDKASTIGMYDFLNTFLCNPEITSLNITHNLSDLEYMPGNYYYFSEQGLTSVVSKSDAIDMYIKGELNKN